MTSVTSSMASATTRARPAVGRNEQISTRIVFFIVGLAMAAWAPLVPFAQARAGLSDGTLGLLLLSLGTGSIATMTAAGALAARIGCRRIVIAAAVPICLTLPVLATAADPLLLAAALFAFGAGLGAIDISMNVQAIVVERASGRAMMSGFHGLFSIGGIAGAAGVSMLLSVGLSPFGATLCVVAALIVALAAAAPHLLPYGGRREGAAFAVPRGIVLFIGALCFVAFLAEGAMLDWSAVFLTSSRGMPSAYAGIGYAVFSLTMTAGRLLGDPIVHRIGGANVVIGGGLCATLGFALAALLPSWPATLIGCALIGIGCANIVPVLYTAIGRQSVMPEHAAVAGVTTLGYAGILIGPAGIGFVAHAAGLPMAFALLAVLQFGVAASGRVLRT